MDKNVLAETYAWFVTALPNPPQNQLQVQMGCHFEEVGEQIDEMEALDPETAYLMTQARKAITALADRLKFPDVQRVEVKNRLKFLDALCDQIVTATGTAYLADLKIVGGLNEVNRSNYTKFDEHGSPVFKENGKIGKSERYEEADLEPFI
tara:strand:+ start:532 stop:984 length:453 start_codon:yes stop_codon:yes gene_type:complete